MCQLVPIAQRQTIIGAGGWGKHGAARPRRAAALPPRRHRMPFRRRIERGTPRRGEGRTPTLPRAGRIPRPMRDGPRICLGRFPLETRDARYRERDGDPGRWGYDGRRGASAPPRTELIVLAMDSANDPQVASRARHHCWSPLQRFERERTSFEKARFSTPHLSCG